MDMTSNELIHRYLQGIASRVIGGSLVIHRPGTVGNTLFVEHASGDLLCNPTNPAS